MKLLRPVLLSLLVPLTATAQDVPPPSPPSPPSPTAPPPAAPVPPVPPMAPVAPAPPAIDPIALEQYRREAIYLNPEEFVTFSASRFGDHVSGRISTRTVLHPTRGDQQERLEGAAFYRAVGRDDLADAYTQRRNIRLGAGIAAGVVLAFGVYEVVHSISIRGETFSNDHCVPDDTFAACVEADRRADARLEDEADGHLRTGLISAGLALAAGAVVGALVPSQPVGDHERRRLIADHNRALRERLGLPEPALQVEPYATATGGGVSVRGQF